MLGIASRYFAGRVALASAAAVVLGLVTGMDNDGHIVMFGTILGPIVAGVTNDATGSYTVGFTFIALLASTGVIFFLMIQPPAPPTRVTPIR